MKIIKQLFVLMTMIFASFAAGEDLPGSMEVRVISENCNDVGVYGCYVRDGYTMDGSYGIVLVVYYNANVTFKSVAAPAGVTLRDGSVVTLDWDDPTDSIAISKFTLGSNIKVRVAEGKSFYANGSVYQGELTRAQISSIAGTVLRPLSGVTLNQVEDRLVATIDDESSDLVIPEDIDVDSVILTRTFVENIHSTSVLPFDVSISAISGANFYEVSVFKEEGVWYAGIGDPVSSITAHHPYLMKASSSGVIVTVPVTLKSTLNASTSQVLGDWAFVGVYRGKSWGTDDAELGYAYGFAAESRNNYKPGDFARAGVGASIAPNRAYLLYTSAKRNRPCELDEDCLAEIESDVLPDYIEVRYLNTDVVLGVSKKIGGYMIGNGLKYRHDAKGRRLNRKPDNFYFTVK